MRSSLSLTSPVSSKVCKNHKNYRFSDNLPHSQALLEDQLARITWRDIIFLFRGTVSLIYFGSLFCPTPRYAGEAPSYLGENEVTRVASSSDCVRAHAKIWAHGAIWGTLF